MPAEWEEYYEASGYEPRETLMRALELHGPEAGFGVDLGCGAGRDTAELLRRGWRVLAIDGDTGGIERVRRLADLAPERLETEHATFEDARWPPADLVNASYSLPFCPPASFEAVWARIVDSLPPGGRFCGQLFGDRDQWASSGLAVQTRAEAEELLRPFVLELFDEVEEDGTTALGQAKHWHVFHVVARRR